MGRPVALLVGLSLLLGASCHLVGGTDGLYIDPSLDPASLSGGGGDGGTGGSPMTSTGGGTQLCEAERCDGVDTDCRHRVCLDNECNFDNVDTLTPCDDDSGSYCDGLGKCVACIDDELTPCPDNGTCQSFVCYPAGCGDGTLNNGESDVDCGGPSCGPCENGFNCQDGSDCISTICNGALECAPCTDHPQCGAGRYCDVGSGACVPQGDIFGGCTEHFQCLSGCCPGVNFCATPGFCP